MSRGMNTELMRRLWIKLNCWPETASLQKKTKKKGKESPFLCLFSSSRSSVWVKMKGGPMQKVRWVVCRTFTARTIVCGPIAAQNSTHCWNQAIAMYCVCVQAQTTVESKLLYCDVQSGFRAKCAHCLSYAIRIYTKKVDESFVCRFYCLRVHQHLQQSVIIVL